MKKLLFILCCSAIFLFSACGSSGIYDGVEKEIIEQEGEENYSEYSEYEWDARYLMRAKSFKPVATIIMLASVTLGVFLSLAFRNVPQMLKIGVLGFVITVPYVFLWLIYLLPYMYKCFGAEIAVLDFSLISMLNYWKRIAPFLITGFELAGWFMVIAFHRVKQLQKFGIFAFMIGFPLLIFVSVYFLAFLYGWNWSLI